jgi:CheY-like chemotaxis protein
VLLDLAHEKGFKGLIATQAADAFTLLGEYTIAGITLDLRLPDADGWTVLDRVKQNPATRHIPVHVISAAANQARGRKLGALGISTKPASKEELDGALVKLRDFALRGARRLLIVEDDAQAQQAMIELIGGGDVETTAVSSGQAALQALESQHFDCMVLDLTLPDISGFELLSQVHARESLRYLPIIIYTARELTKKEETELSLMSDAIVVKDVRSPERLLAETALFLHRVDATLPQPKRSMLERVKIDDPVLAGRKVLVVDDDVRNIVALTALLESHQVKVSYAESGKEALTRLAEAPDTELVLMDIMMPEMDGYEAMQAIRSQPRFAKLPIIALTAKAMKGDRDRCIAAGASDYITKPLDQEQLLSLLRVWSYR